MSLCYLVVWKKYLLFLITWKYRCKLYYLWLSLSLSSLDRVVTLSLLLFILYHISFFVFVCIFYIYLAQLKLSLKILVQYCGAPKFLSINLDDHRVDRNVKSLGESAMIHLSREMQIATAYPWWRDRTPIVKRSFYFHYLVRSIF